MDLNNKLIGEKVRALRLKHGLTGKMLAKKMRMAPSQISKLETGIQDWRSARLITFAKVLGVDPTFFFVEGEEVEQTDVARELNKAGLMASNRLISALKDPGFLKLMERCARVAMVRENGLRRLEQATKPVL